MITIKVDQTCFDSIYTQEYLNKSNSIYWEFPKNTYGTITIDPSFLRKFNWYKAFFDNATNNQPSLTTYYKPNSNPRELQNNVNKKIKIYMHDILIKGDMSNSRFSGFIFENVNGKGHSFNYSQFSNVELSGLKLDRHTIKNTLTIGDKNSVILGQASNSSQNQKHIGSFFQSRNHTPNSSSINSVGNSQINSQNQVQSLSTSNNQLMANTQALPSSHQGVNQSNNQINSNNNDVNRNVLSTTNAAQLSFAPLIQQFTPSSSSNNSSTLATLSPLNSLHPLEPSQPNNVALQQNRQPLNNKRKHRDISDSPSQHSLSLPHISQLQLNSKSPGSEQKDVITIADEKDKENNPNAANIAGNNGNQNLYKAGSPKKRPCTNHAQPAKKISVHDAINDLNGDDDIEEFSQPNMKPNISPPPLEYDPIEESWNDNSAGNNIIDLSR